MKFGASTMPIGITRRCQFVFALLIATVVALVWLGRSKAPRQSAFPDSYRSELKDANVSMDPAQSISIKWTRPYGFNPVGRILVNLNEGWLIGAQDESGAFGLLRIDPRAENLSAADWQVGRLEDFATPLNFVISGGEIWKIDQRAHPDLNSSPFVIEVRNTAVFPFSGHQRVLADGTIDLTSETFFQRPGRFRRVQKSPNGNVREYEFKLAHFVSATEEEKKINRHFILEGQENPITLQSCRSNPQFLILHDLSYVPTVLKVGDRLVQATEYCGRLLEAVHRGPIERAVCDVSPTGKHVIRLAIGSNCSTYFIEVWDVESGKLCGREKFDVLPFDTEFSRLPLLGFWSSNICIGCNQNEMFVIRITESGIVVSRTKLTLNSMRGLYDIKMTDKSFVILQNADPEILLSWVSGKQIESMVSK